MIPQIAEMAWELPQVLPKSSHQLPSIAAVVSFLSRICVGPPLSCRYNSSGSLAVAQANDLVFCLRSILNLSNLLSSLELDRRQHAWAAAYSKASNSTKEYYRCIAESDRRQD